MLTATTRLCATCRAILPDPPAPQVCPKCGRVAIAHHLEWDPRLRLFIAAAYFGRHAIGNARSEQLGWEDALRSLIAGAGGTHPNPFGILFEAPPLECYPIGVKLAAHWRAAGGPIANDLIETIGRGAGLIAPSFPTARRAS